MNLSLLCADAVPKNLHLFDFGIAPPLMLYSYIPAIALSFLIGFFVMLKSKFALTGKLLFAISLSFSFWVFNYLFQWTIAYVNPDMFSWKLGALLILPMFYFALYFVYVFLNNKDASVLSKILISLTLLPVLVWMPSELNMKYFNVTTCEGAIGPLWYYIYSIEALLILFIIYLGIKHYIRSDDRKYKKETIFLLIGTVSFLGISWSSDVLGEWTKQYQLNFIGPIGMVVFIGLLAYLIVKFKAFNIKLIATQALIIALVALIGSQFFFADTTTSIILTLITLLIALGFGFILVKSVKLEVQRKEELENLSGQLAIANDKLHQLDKAKSEFISIASHQLRTPLTSIKGFGSLLLEGTYGVVPETQRGALEKIYISNERLIQLVEDLLNISRIEAGRMEFDFQESQIEDLVQEAVNTLELSAKAKNLYLTWEKPTVLMPKLKIDITKIKEVISNMVDNAIKYTQKGGITVRLEKSTAWDTEHKEHKELVRVIVSDTGIGMDEEEINMIFEKFQRGKQVAHYHTDGTGLGMYIGKKIVAEHKGRIWAESDGRGKGSRFILELPVN